MKNGFRTNLSLVVIVSFGVFGCEGPTGENGFNSVIATSMELPGENCSYGGIKINSGIDKNSNGFLDSSEIDNTSYVCNGEDSDLDKQIILFLGGYAGSFSDTQFVSPSQLPYFDIRDYANIDSVFFLVKDIQTKNNYGYDYLAEGTIELYDMTNSQVIENSSIISDDIPAGTYRISSDFIESIPIAKFNLGIRLTGGSDFRITCGNMFLILKRK